MTEILLGKGVKNETNKQNKMAKEPLSIPFLL
jgi:hypothetical protein